MMLQHLGGTAQIQVDEDGHGAVDIPGIGGRSARIYANDYSVAYAAMWEGGAYTSMASPWGLRTLFRWLLGEGPDDYQEHVRCGSDDAT
jgi:hypothetical protein